MAEQLVIKINGNVDDYKAALDLVREDTKSLEGALSSVAKKSAIAFAGLGAAVLGVVNEASKIETMTVQFEVLTGSVSQATKMVKDLQKFSAATPFQLAGIAKASQQLLGFGFEAEEIIPKLQQIGDVASAINRPIEEVGFIFGQVAAAGKLTGERLLQFQERAIPIADALAKVMNKPKSAIKDLVSKGEVDFKTFEKAFASLSAKGGTAFEGMIKQSKTLAGLISTTKDNFSLLAADIGKELLPMFKELAVASIKGMQFLKSNPELIEMTASFLKFGLAITGGIAAFAAAGVAAIKISSIIGALTLAFGPATLSASAFWVALTGPIGVAVAGIIAVTAAITGLYLALSKKDEVKNLKDINKELEELRKKQDFIKSMTDMQKLSAGFSKEKIQQIDDEIAKLEELKKSKITAETETDDAIKGKKKERTKEEIDAEIEKRERLREIKLEQDELDLGVQVEKEEADLERQILVDELKNDQDLAKINENIKNEEDKTAKLKLVQDRRAMIDKKRDELQLKQQFVSNKQRIEMDNAINKQLTDGAFSLASTLVSVSGASAKKQFIIQRSLGIVQTLINGYMAKGLAEATIPPPAGEIIGANRLLQSRIAAGLIALQSGVEFTGMARGGLVSGGIPGVDSVPIMGQRDEVMVPAKTSFDDLVTAGRTFTEGGDEGAGNSNVNIHVTYDSPEASQIITVSQVEDTALGISRDSFKEAS